MNKKILGLVLAIFLLCLHTETDMEISVEVQKAH